MNLKTEVRLIIIFIFTVLLQKVESVVFLPLQKSTKHQYQPLTKQLVPKVSLTQKGYIQFLRYVVDVPELTDYTFCIWVRSNNLTYNHPLLSYSKHEEERLIRVWISPLGSHINLEILEVPIFSIPVHFVENEWYHICQSWSSYLAAWSFYLNGKLRANGYAQKLKKVPIKAGGDIIVGQEYTDFDKGLDDGIEGDVSGFNFILASSFNNGNFKHLLKPLEPYNNLLKRTTRDGSGIFYDPSFTENKDVVDVTNLNSEKQGKSLARRQIWDESLELFSMHKLMPPLPLDTSLEEPVFKPRVSKGHTYSNYLGKPLGLLLVELSNNCGYLRGAPLNGKGVLVSWTKTKVRVFGGAILKTVPPFCKK